MATVCTGAVGRVPDMSTEQFASLRRGTTAEELASVLREMIMTGALAPEQQLREEHLSVQFDVSRRTVRDALGILAHERIVRHYRHRGSRVVQFSEDDIHDLYGIRRTLEGAAATQVRRAPAPKFDELKRAFDELSHATGTGVAADIVRRDLEFHRAVVGLLDSPRFDEFFSTIAVEMRFALAIIETTYAESEQRPDEALEEHRAIYAALVARDVRLAKRLLDEHAHTYEELLVKALAQPALVDDGAT